MSHKAVDPRHRHYVAGAELAEHAEKLAPVRARARGLLAVDVPAAASGGAKLLKLSVEGLPVGGDAADGARHYVRFPPPAPFADRTGKVSSGARRAVPSADRE